MDITVIIPTYNGVHKIGNLLKALEVQTFTDFEVVVVVDGSTDNTEAVLSEQKYTLSNLQIISQNNSGRAASRNRGAREAGGQLLIFFDDDMRPAADCVAQHIQHHQLYNRTICIGTQIDDYTKSTTDIQRYKCYLSRKWEKKVDIDYAPLSKENIYLTAANFSISKELFWCLGGFDERLRDGEDYELALRACQAAIPLYYNKKAFAWHDDRISCRSYIKRQREYSVWNQKINELKDTKVAEVFKRFDISETPAWKKQIFRLFAAKLWVQAIDTFNVFQILPKKLRYKVYDLIITGLSRHYTHIKID
jgi:GT2 family glycosyltransferase